MQVFLEMRRLNLYIYWTVYILARVLIGRVKKIFKHVFLRKIIKLRNVNYFLEWNVTWILLYVIVSELDALMKHIREQTWCNISLRAAWSSVWCTLIKELTVQHTPKKNHFFIFTHVLTLFRNLKCLYTRISISRSRSRLFYSSHTQ